MALLDQQSDIRQQMNMHRMVTTDPRQMSSDGRRKLVVLRWLLCPGVLTDARFFQALSSTGMIPGRWAPKSPRPTAAFTIEVQAMEPAPSWPTAG